ncbi:MAG: hypothetical protein B7Z16_19050 [Algoriphagus sp. 32-45-6]|nr:MAG: hypothetical protein B7Z16_19050 [Algoriphagus sp. 32-45-6]
MPIDLVITYKDGSQEMIYLPLAIMRGQKGDEAGMPSRIFSDTWPWTNLSKTIVLTKPFSSIKSVEIDPSKRLADLQQENNKVEF